MFKFRKLYKWWFATIFLSRQRFVIYFFSNKIFKFVNFLDPSLAVRCSIPGGLFIASSFALLIVAQMLQQHGIA